MGALSGSNASVVTPSRDGAKLAVKQFLAENEDCDITLEEFDTEGDPAKATPLANQIATNDEFIGIIGGAFSGETRAMKPIFQEAGVVMISQSATATDLTQVDQVDVFHRVVGYDDVQGAAIANFLEANATKVFVVDDSTDLRPAAGRQGQGRPRRPRGRQRQDPGGPDGLRGRRLQGRGCRSRRGLLRRVRRRGGPVPQAAPRRRHHGDVRRW